MTGNGCCCQFRGVEGTQVAASMKKELEVFPPLASDKTRSSSNQFLSLETSSMDAHELTSLLATQPEGQYLVPPLLPPACPHSWLSPCSDNRSHGLRNHPTPVRPSPGPEELRTQILNPNKRSIQLCQMTATSAPSSVDGHICL